jgi:hypothetical protein
MAKSGFTSNTPNGFGLFGVLYKAFNTGSGAGTKIGVSRGGLRFVPNTEIRNVEYDGKMVARQGLDRIVGRNPQITGTIIELRNENLMFVEPGGATPETLQGQGAFLSAGQYHTNVAVAFERPNGSIFGYNFPKALVVQYEVAGQSAESEAEMAVTIEARLADQGATPDETEVPVEFFEIAAP